MGVVPRAGVKLPQDQAPGELPGVDEADVDGEPPPRPPASAEVQVKVELLHHEAAAAVHQERPQGRVAAEGPVWLLNQVEDGGEDDLVQEAMHPEKQEPHKARETRRTGPAAITPVPRVRFAQGAGVLIPQPRHAPVEHLAEVESQDVVRRQLRPWHHPHLLGQSVHVADQDQFHVLA